MSRGSTESSWFFGDRTGGSEEPSFHGALAATPVHCPHQATLLHELGKRCFVWIATEEIDEVMLERVRTFRSLLSETPVDQLEVREYPAVLFRVSSNTWLEAIVRYLVERRRAGRVKSKLIEKMLEALNAEPDKAMSPKGAAR